MHARTMTNPSRSRGELLRAAAARGFLAIPGAPFPLVAKLASAQGFEAVYLSGAAMSAGLLAVPDIGLITLEQLAEQTRLLAEASDLPVLVDADTGFGGPRDVEHTVKTLEAAGAAGIQLEDQVPRKRCGHLPGKQVVDASQMREKIAAASAARRDASTVILGRSDARGVNGIDDCIARLEGYRDAGADWLFPEGLTSRDEFRAVGSAIDVPLVANMTEFGMSPLLQRKELAAMGYAAVLYPVTLLRVAMKAMEAALAVIDLEDTQESLLDLMQSREELYELLDYDPTQPFAEGSWRFNEDSRLA